MQQTKKYQFNLIEGSDPFSPQPLNENMEKTEAAFAAQQADAAAQFAALPRMHLTSYTGDGQATRTFTFPFKPSVVFLVCLYNTNNAPQMLVQGQEVAVMSYGASLGDRFLISWTGNSVKLTAADSGRGGGVIFNGSSSKYAVMGIQIP